MENPWTWNTFGHIMCVDVPMGVGFSYNKNGNLTTNTRDAANHFINFLSNFYKNNAKFGLIGNPLILAGNYYAGHTIPVIA